MFIKNINAQNSHSNIFLPSDNKEKSHSQYDDFSRDIKKILEEINYNHNNTISNTEKFESNEPNISLNDIMIDWQRSSISIQMAVQVRNKVISAYQEIMNQQV